MTLSPHESFAHETVKFGATEAQPAGSVSHSLAGRNVTPVLMLGGDESPPERGDPGTVILTCANCGAEMIERKCKLICRCGYFLSCSDYY